MAQKVAPKFYFRKNSEKMLFRESTVRPTIVLEVKIQLEVLLTFYYLLSGNF